MPLSPLEYVPLNRLIAPGEEVTLTGNIAMKLDTKYEYLNKGGALSEVIYEFRVTFYGINEFGREIEAQGSAHARFANFESN